MAAQEKQYQQQKVGNPAARDGLVLYGTIVGLRDGLPAYGRMVCDQE